MSFVAQEALIHGMPFGTWLYPWKKLVYQEIISQ